MAYEGNFPPIVEEGVDHATPSGPFQINPISSYPQREGLRDHAVACDIRWLPSRS